MEEHFKRRLDISKDLDEKEHRLLLGNKVIRGRMEINGENKVGPNTGKVNRSHTAKLTGCLLFMENEEPLKASRTSTCSG